VEHKIEILNIMNGIKKINNMPIIGILGWKVGESSYGCTLPYIEFANQYGMVRIITPQEPIDERLDLIIVPGGADVNPGRYGQAPHMQTSKSDPIKEYFDNFILPQYIDIGTPIFGICRGIQAIAVHFGAKLIQHMYHESNDDNRYDGVHSISLTEPFRAEFLRTHEGNKKITGNFKVNSMHHQCVSFHNFPDELEVIGLYSGKYEFRSIEVIRHRELPIYAVQYHPEELGHDILSDYIMNKLLFPAEIVIHKEFTDNK